MLDCYSYMFSIITLINDIKFIATGIAQSVLRWATNWIVWVRILAV
jgi:hypothetical protein